MSIESLVKLLTTAKFDVHLESAPDGTACPYIVLEDLTQPNFAADNETYSTITSLQLTLVESEVHNWTLISTLKGVLDGIPLPYSAEYIKDDTEHVCEVRFVISFLGGIEDA